MCQGTPFFKYLPIKHVYKFSAHLPHACSVMHEIDYFKYILEVVLQD